MIFYHHQFFLNMIFICMIDIKTYHIYEITLVSEIFCVILLIPNIIPITLL